MAPSGMTVAVLEPGYRDYEIERSILAEADAELVPVPPERDTAASLSELDPVAILVREREVSAAHLAAAGKLKAIVRYGVGVDNIDLEAARRRRIYVANVPDYGADEVSDHALALYLAVARRIVSRDRQVREGQWNLGQAEPIHPARGATLGIVGFGRIARRALEKFRVLGFARVLVADPGLTAEEAAGHGVDLADLDRLCEEADAITLHLPLTAANRNLIDGRRLGLMKSNCVLINTARGGLIDEEALAAALRAGRLFGAGLDVFANEPPNSGDPLFACSNLVVTDHMAWYSESSVAELQRKAAEEVQRVLRGEPPRAWVNAWSGTAAS